MEQSDRLEAMAQSLQKLGDAERTWWGWEPRQDHKRKESTHD
jgi:hypothetical protein